MEKLMTSISLPAIQMLLCLLVGLAILQLKAKLARNPALPREKALKFLTGALGVWFAMGLVQVIAEVTNWSGISKELLMSSLSGVSDLFAILAVTQLEFAPSRLRSSRVPAWPFMMVGFGILAQFILAFLPGVATSEIQIRLWGIPGTLVSVVAGVVLILGFYRSFRQYDFAFPWWLIFATLFLLAWVVVQPLYLVRPFDDSQMLRLVSTAGLAVFAISSMTLLLAWINSVATHTPVEYLFANNLINDSPDNLSVVHEIPITFAVESKLTTDNTDTGIVLNNKWSLFVDKGECILGKNLDRIRRQPSELRMVAVDIETEEMVFAHNEYELANFVERAQARIGSERRFYARNLGMKLRGEV